MSKFQVLGIYLQARGEEVRVGSLTRDARNIVRFDIDESYIELGSNRPVLSSSLLRYGNEEETIELLRAGPMVQAGREIPAWFSNLLPEGALRDMVMRGMPTGHTSDYDVLAWLGEDLPGAVVVRPEEGAEIEFQFADKDERQSGIRFSLAGVQLKMSMLKQGERLTFPAVGEHGNIVAKLPSEKYRNLPEVEFSSMKLAEAVGITIPQMDLVSTKEISGLDNDILKGGDLVLAVQRFDRTPDGQRVHMEDFLQILGEQPTRKYTAANEETVVNIANRLGGGTEAFLQAVRRVAANVLMGNTDAHLKNWSLWYPDASEGMLSPAYDIVASYVYDRRNDMALRFRNTHNSEIIALNRFRKLASLCDVPEKRLDKEVKLVVEQAADQWREMLKGLPMPDDLAQALIKRTQKLALVKEFKRLF